MSRTYVLPVTDTLTFALDDVIPAELVFRDLASSTDPALPRSHARQYFPFDYDPIAKVYNQANQEIVKLGVIDPVELWEKTAATPEARNAPDDFIATLSIVAESPGDPSAAAVFGLIDGNNQPRLTPFSLPVLPAAPGTFPVSTRYGIPMFTGDRLIVGWAADPELGSSAIITLNLTACTKSELQLAAAAWVTANCGCVTGADCSNGPKLTKISSAPSIVGGLPPGPPNIYAITIQGMNFAPSDVITISDPSVLIVGLPVLVLDEWFFDISAPPETPVGPLVFTVTDENSCGANIALFVTPPS